jgi:hypothetical protein
MKIAMHCHIKKTASLSFEQTEKILKNGTSLPDKLFPTTILKGTVSNGEIIGKILPVSGIVDPFKSRIKGKISEKDNTTALNFQIKPSWILIIFALTWYSLLVLWIIGIVLNKTDATSQDAVIGISFAMLPYLLLRIKIFFDKRRFERWLCRRIMEEDVNNNNSHPQ